MTLRRPPSMRWSQYNEDCIKILTNFPAALPSDKWLCHLVRALHLVEDIGFQFSMDDPVSEVAVTDPKTQYHLKTFEKQLEEWHQRALADVGNTCMHIQNPMLYGVNPTDIDSLKRPSPTHGGHHQPVHA